MEKDSLPCPWCQYSTSLCTKVESSDQGQLEACSALQREAVMDGLTWCRRESRPGWHREKRTLLLPLLLRLPWGKEENKVGKKKTYLW